MSQPQEAAPPPRRITLEEIERMQIFPRTAIRIQEIAQDPNASFEDLERCVSMDPVLGARVLRVANSPYYRVSREIGSLKHAISLMGFREVQRIALTVALLARMEASPIGETMWKHAVRTGCIARRLAVAVRVAEPGDVFVAGVLHDIGKLILLHVYGAYYQELLTTVPHGDVPVAELERLQIDHASLAAMVLERWKLPQATVRAVQYHHLLDVMADPLRGKADTELVVSVADALAHLTAEGATDGAIAGWLLAHPSNGRFGFERNTVIDLMSESRGDWSAMG